MLINELKLKNFRNYDEVNIKFSKNINIIYGNNAQGKTNILEAISLTSIGKSFRTNKDKEMIKFGENFATVEVKFSKTDRDEKIKINLSDKKDVFVNEIKIKKLSELLGNLNVVIFTPDDINILKNGPAQRRKFLDIFISQLRPNYLHCLNIYIKILEQRNNYLKQIKLENANCQLLDVWDEKLVEYTEKIFVYRQEFIEKIKQCIQPIHNKITDSNEKIEIEYVSDFKTREEFKKIIGQRRKYDIFKGHTSNGIHKDDFNVYINGNLVNVYGSQGQHRTAMLSLKMSELEVISKEIGEYPVLLLDDFMSELDEKRRMNFLKDIENMQVFITCTDKFELEKNNFSVYNVNAGVIQNTKIY